MVYEVEGYDYRYLDTKNIFFAEGGRIIVKILPDESILSCTQEGNCDEFAQYIVLMFGSEESQDLICTLCDKHLKALYKVKELRVPVMVYN